MRGGGEGKERSTPEAQKDSTGAQGDKKRTARTQPGDTEVEGDGARTYVRTYGWEST